MSHIMQIISDAYTMYHHSIQKYVANRINDAEEAMDITQDVFVRLLGYDIISESTIKSLCFTVANNLVIDYLRRHYKFKEVYSYMYETQQKKYVPTPEQIAAAKDLANRERCLMLDLPPATARVYEMTQIKEMTIDEISCELGISRRTVECHQLRGRKYVREQIRNII